MNAASLEGDLSKRIELFIPRNPYQPEGVDAHVRNCETGECELFVFWEPPSGPAYGDNLSYVVTVEPGSHTCRTSRTWCSFSDNIQSGLTYKVSVEAEESFGQESASVRVTVSGSYVRSAEAIGEDCHRVDDPRFSDISPGTALAGDVGCLVALDLVADGDGKPFEPQRAINRGEFAEWVAGLWDRVTGRDCGLVNISRTFADVPRSHRNAEAISCLADLEVVRGTAPGRYSPDRLITRAEAAVMVSRTLDAMTRLRCRAQSHFNDVPKLSFFGSSVNCLRANGIVSGSSATSFEPYRLLSRSQGSAMIARTFRLLLNGKYSATP